MTEPNRTEQLEKEITNLNNWLKVNKTHSREYLLEAMYRQGELLSELKGRKEMAEEIIKQINEICICKITREILIEKIKKIAIGQKSDCSSTSKIVEQGD